VPSSDAGFDIAASGNAFASLTITSGDSNLYSVNLTTGAATLIGALPAPLSSLTILPPDNCPTVAGDDQADLDADGIGDACDPDIDGDGLSNAAESAIGSNPRSTDSDGDGKLDGADACPTEAASTANGCPDIPALPDKTAPTVTVSKLAKKLKFSKFLKGVTLRVKPSESSSFLFELVAAARKATVSKAGDVVLASSSLKLGAGERSVKLRPNRKLVAGRRKFTVTVRVTATDAAGNRKVVTKKLSVTR
jgi:hypothetical protein